MKYITFTNLNEEKLRAKERNQLPDDVFGIPSLRKFPMHDKNHVMECIKKFNYVDEEHEAELARNVKKKMKEYGIPKDVVGEKNRLKKYL